MFRRNPDKARIGFEILPLEVGYLPPYFISKAHEELNKTEESKVQSIQQLKEMITKLGDDHMKSINFKEDFLVAQLRTRKYNIDKSFKALKSFVSVTLKNPLMFCNFNFDETVKCIRDEVVTMLPWRCQDGCAILYVQLGNWITEDFPIEEVRRMLVVVLMQAARDPMTQVNGFKAIIDVGPGENGFDYLKQCGIRNLYLLYHCTQECIPGRYKGVHIMNYSFPFYLVWQVFKSFMSRKLINRIHFHKSHEELFKYFPRAIVPAKYGGDLVDYDQTEWLRKVMSPEILATLGGGAINPLATIPEDINHVVTNPKAAEFYNQAAINNEANNPESTNNFVINPIAYNPVAINPL